MNAAHRLFQYLEILARRSQIALAGWLLDAIGRLTRGFGSKLSQQTLQLVGGIACLRYVLLAQAQPDLLQELWILLQEHPGQFLQKFDVAADSGQRCAVIEFTHPLTPSVSYLWLQRILFKCRFRSSSEMVHRSQEVADPDRLAQIAVHPGAQ